MTPDELLKAVDATLRRLARRWAKLYRLNADDLLQDARLLIVERAHQFDPAKNTPDGWAATVARGAVRDGVRAEAREQGGRRRRLESMPTIGHSLPDLLSGETADRVAVALASLPDDQARIVRRIYGLGCPPVGGIEALAREERCHHSTVSRQLAAALSSLRESLDS